MRTLIEVYLNFRGNAADAAQYYAKVFGSDAPNIMRYSEMPEQDKGSMPEGTENLVMHAYVQTFAGGIMLADDSPGSTAVPNSSMWVCLSHTDEKLLHRAFDGLAKDGEVIMPLENTFFSPLYGQVKDKFGFHWMFMVPSPME